MTLGVAAAVLLGAYLLGSISFSYLIVRGVRGIDVRQVGSGNAGATNVMRAAGKGSALLALALDAGKGVAAVGLTRLLAPSPTPTLAGLAAAAVVVGHVYPVFLGFRGGKGVATAAGALFTLAWQPTLAAAGVFVLVIVWKRFVSLASILAAVSVPLWVAAGVLLGWVAPESAPAFIPSVTLVAILVVVKHRANLKRLRSGSEPRLGASA